jgi:hypothetical protein
MMRVPPARLIREVRGEVRQLALIPCQARVATA